MPVALLVGLVLLLGLVVATTPAGAQESQGQKPGSGLFLTIAARSCPTYADITANRARNDIQESLRDLGPNTPYSSREKIDPDVEQRTQPNCTPLADWDFTFGDGYRSRAVAGPWGALSIVKNPIPQTVRTQPSVPLLNSHAQSTGREIQGAVTIELTEQEARRAGRHNRFWIQGGTPTDPILDQRFPGQYGFGALRCAIDNLNGDNVEWISYPQGSTHVFCFAYYVKPPPTSGTIVVEKTVAGGGAARATFPFDGNLSFNTGGRFDLAPTAGSAATRTFVRAETRTGDEPWRVRELIPHDWKLTDLSCTSQSGKSTAATSRQNAEAQITLAAADTVTCTFTNAPVPPDGGLSISKVTEGGVGRFDFTVTPLGGGAGSAFAARTTKEGVAAPAAPDVLTLAPGRYRIRERLPQAPGGRWVQGRVVCDGAPVEPREGAIDITIPAGDGIACVFRNRFVPKTGSITIFKVTRGGIGEAAFLVSPLGPHTSSQIRGKTAVTSRQGEPARALGQPTRRLPLGRYVIHELVNQNQFEKEFVRCNKRIFPFARGQTVVHLTERQPDVSCTFTNRRKKQAVPPLATPQVPKPIEQGTPELSPGPSQPTQPPEPVAPPKDPVGPPVRGVPPELITGAPQAPEPVAVPSARLRVTKAVSRKRIRLGESVTYVIQVTNDGPHTAQDVVVFEDSPAAGLIRSLRSSKGTCGVRPLPRRCDLGVLSPGESVRIVARVQPTAVGLFTNRVAVGSTTASELVEVGRGAATLRTLRRPGRGISFTG